MPPSSAMPGDAALNRLRWRCRRGMRELDQLLGAWLEANAGSADAAGLATFEALLDCEDSDLWTWFAGRSRPQDARLSGLVDEIRRTHRA